jgi:SAM-dependent methyltransferase
MERILSVHFPKAAGSSLQVQFMKLLGDEVILDYGHDPLTPAGMETADFPDRKTLVMGHFRAQRYASADAFWMTFLRHPVDNLISIYFFWKLLPEAHALHARFLREQPSILEFAMYPGLRNLMSETYFGGFDMNRFDFIGFHENREDDIVRLAKAINLPLLAAIHENRTSESAERLELESDVSVRSKLTDLLAQDVGFYERMLRRKTNSPSPEKLKTSKLICSVCGGTVFADRPVLWDKLISEWQLGPHERSYIDRQQGTCCTSCGANLRSIALADAIRATFGITLTLIDFVMSEAKDLAVLEINEAGNLSSVLQQIPGHISANYPAIDMHAMPYSDDTFDLVVHSDTLEHVSNPIRALEECRRVLRPGAAVCFTIPTIVERLSRSRAGLSKSYHGNPEMSADDHIVHTEFGADMWTYVFRAGFSAVSINAVDYPSALALSARKGTCNLAL